MVTLEELNKSFGQTQVAEPIDKEKQACEAKGGTWDPLTRTCKLPEPKKSPEQQQQEQEIANLQPSTTTAGVVGGEIKIMDTTPEVDKGKDFKVDFNPDGTVTYTGGGKSINMTREEYKNFQESQKGPEGGSYTQTPQLAELQGLTPQARQAAYQQQLLSQIGQAGALTPAQEAKINHRQAFIAGLANVIPSLVGGAATGFLAGGIAGAGVGSTVTAPAGAIIGAIAGAATGISSGYINNVKTQQRGEIGAAREELTAAKSNMRQFAMMASQDPANAEEYIELYNAQLTRAKQARRQVKLETQGDLNSWIEDGRQELADFDAFLQPGGKADLYGQRLRIALSEGVPLGVEDFTEAELKEMFEQ